MSGISWATWGAILGVICGLVFVWLGFKTTLFIIIVGGIGYLIGHYLEAAGLRRKQ